MGCPQRALRGLPLCLAVLFLHWPHRSPDIAPDPAYLVLARTPSWGLWAYTVVEVDQRSGAAQVVAELEPPAGCRSDEQLFWDMYDQPLAVSSDGRLVVWCGGPAGGGLWIVQVPELHSGFIPLEIGAARPEHPPSPRAGDVRLPGQRPIGAQRMLAAQGEVVVLASDTLALELAVPEAAISGRSAPEWRRGGGCLDPIADCMGGLVVGTFGALIVDGDDGRVRSWLAPKAVDEEIELACTGTLPPRSRIYEVAAHEDGLWVAAGSENLFFHVDTIARLDVRSPASPMVVWQARECGGTLERCAPHEYPRRGEDDRWRGYSFSRTRAAIAASRRGVLVIEGPGPGDRTRHAVGGEALDVAFLPNGDLGVVVEDEGRSLLRVFRFLEHGPERMAELVLEAPHGRLVEQTSNGCAMMTRPHPSAAPSPRAGAGARRGDERVEGHGRRRLQ